MEVERFLSLGRTVYLGVIDWNEWIVVLVIGLRVIFRVRYCYCFNYFVDFFSF